jgi:TolB-like protein/tetratricopeptide (TPR) repeat protein
MMPARSSLPVRWRVFGAAVAGLLAGTLWLRATGTPPQPPPPRPAAAAHSIALVPFVNENPDSTFDYLSAGVTADLASVLGRIPGLRVAANGSGSARAGRNPAAVGRRLGVGSVLHGSIRQVGDRLRVSAHLVSVDGGFDLWSEAYERPAADLLVVENEIVAAIVATLRLRGPSGQVVALPAIASTTPEAHTAFLQGRFDEAVRLDSSYAPGWAGLAAVALRRFITEAEPPGDVIPAARTAAERAITLDSSLAEARITRAAIWLLYDRDFDKAGEELQRAIALDPNRPGGFHWQSHRFLALGEVDSALAAARRAIESSPLDPSLRAHLAWHHLLAREDSLADRSFAQALALDSTIAASDEHFAWRPAHSAEPGAAYDSLKGLARERYVSPYSLAVAAAAAGRTGPALAALGRAIDERTPAVPYLALDPRLDTLRRSRRFEALLVRLHQATIPSRPKPPIP